MSARGEISSPAFLLIGGAIATALALVVYARVNGAAVSPHSAAPIAVERVLRFVDRANGSVAIIDATRNVEVGAVPTGEGGFVRGILRSMARERRANDIGAEPPFTLAERTDGTVFIRDTATGRAIELDAFGSTNQGSFERLLRLEKARS